jgi:hypothetical protein
MKRILSSGAALALACCIGACQSPTTATAIDVTLSAAPDPAPAVQSSGVTYTVTNADSTVSTYDYDWKTTFTVTVKEEGGKAVDITAVDLRIQQASGGIVITPSGGDKEYYRFNSSASGNHVNAKGTATIGFDVWYDLPNKGREALVTVSLSFKDPDAGSTGSDSVQVKVAP